VCLRCTPENVYCTFRTRAFKNFVRFLRCRVKSELTEARCTSRSTAWLYTGVVTDYGDCDSPPAKFTPFMPVLAGVCHPSAKLSFNTYNHAPAALGSDKSDRVCFLMYIGIICRYIIFYTQQ